MKTNPSFEDLNSMSPKAASDDGFPTKKTGPKDNADLVPHAGKVFIGM